MAALMTIHEMKALLAATAAELGGDWHIAEPSGMLTDGAGHTFTVVEDLRRQLLVAQVAGKRPDRRGLTFSLGGKSPEDAARRIKKMLPRYDQERSAVAEIAERRSALVAACRESLPGLELQPWRDDALVRQSPENDTRLRVVVSRDATTARVEVTGASAAALPAILAALSGPLTGTSAGERGAAENLAILAELFALEGAEVPESLRPEHDGSDSVCCLDCGARFVCDDLGEEFFPDRLVPDGDTAPASCTCGVLERHYVRDDENSPWRKAEES